MPIVEWFREFCALQDAQASFQFAFEHPCLAWPLRWTAIEAWIATAPPELQPMLTGRLALLHKLQAALEHGEVPWPEVSTGLDTLVARTAAGELSAGQAAVQAATPEIALALSPDDMRQRALRTNAAAFKGEWQPALVTYRLMFAAAEACDLAEGRDQLLASVVPLWLMCAAAACHEVPDGRVFSDAVARGERLAAQALAIGNATLASDTCHALGVLHLDPWAAGRNANDMDNQFLLWRQRMADTYGKAVAADPATAVPTFEAALETALQWLERARAGRSGERLGRTLKVLVEVLGWREVRGGPADHVRLREAAQQALALLPGDRYQADRAVVRQWLRLAEQEEPAADSAEGKTSHVGSEGSGGSLAWLEPADLVASVGEDHALERFLWCAKEAENSNPDLSIALLLRIWPQLAGPRREDARRSAMRTLMTAAGSRFQLPHRLEACSNDLDRVQEDLVQEARRQGWPSGQLALALAGLAASASPLDREEEGLHLLERATGLASRGQPASLGALNTLRAGMTFNLGVNASKQGQAELAVQRYLESIALLVDEDLLTNAQEALELAEDAAFKHDGQVPVTLAVGLAQQAPRLACAGGPRLGDRIQDLWNKVLVRTLVSQPVNLELLWLELQACKGAVFATTIARAQAYDWRRDEEAGALLARLARLRADAPGAPLAAAGSSDALDDQDVLVAFAGGRKVNGPEDPVVSLKLRIDSHLARRMTDGSGALRNWLPVEELRRALASSSVLLSQYAGTGPDGQAALITLGLAGDDAFAAMGTLGLPSGTVKMETEGTQLEMGMMGPTVAALRRALLADPGTAQATAEAARMLASDGKNLLGGGLAEHLARLRSQGRSHLCIHPHGPLHFHPQHLVCRGDRTLADDWTVTYLPHPVLLRSPDTARREVRDELVALGIGFAGFVPHGLPPLPAAVPEARDVAAIWNAPCRVDAEATKAGLLDALANARRVHLATHGAMNTSAPSFQSLYLWPDGSSDGVLHACELIGLDLRHVELVTLSACETSLGRFDVSDTLRGMVAFLFAAGVATVVSTLWRVNDQAARVFFTTFHAGLHAQGDRLQAFRSAQLATRARFPAFRDWGAFHYAGRW